MATTLGYDRKSDSTAEGRRARGPAQTSPGARVLVVEDDEDIRFMLKRLLEMRGDVSVVEAENGETAIALATSVRPDLILMDGTLPLLDGFEATRRIRALTSGVPIVFLSGHAQPASRAKAFAVGCTDYFIKPFALDELSGVLERHLSQRKSH